MKTEHKVGDIVKFTLASHFNYSCLEPNIILATHNQPYVRQNGEVIDVPKGYDYLIVKQFIKEGEFFPYIRVVKSQIENFND